MGITGNLSTMSLPDILQWLSMGIKTGTLEFKNNSIIKKIFFREGIIISAKSSDKKDSLGQILLRNQKISQDNIESLLVKQKETGELLGKLLLKEKILTKQELDYFLRLQSEEIVFSLFQWNDATFEFIEGDIPKSEIIPISLKVVSLIMEGTKRQDDWSRIVKALPNPKMILNYTTEGRLSLLTRTLSIEEKSILSLIDGEKSIQEITSHSSLSDFQTYSFLYRLLDEELLEVQGIKDEQSEQNELIEREVIKISDMIEMKEIFKANEKISSLIAQYPEHETVIGLSHKINELLEMEVLNIIPSEDIIPKPDYNKDLARLTELNISAEEGFLLSRIDGVTNIKEIRLISGFSKKEIHFALYRLAMLGVITLSNLKEKKKVEKMTDTGDVPDSAKYFTSDFIIEPTNTSNSTVNSKLDQETSQMIETKYKSCFIGTYYEILDVEPNADTPQIQNNYYKLSKKFHPDKFISSASESQIAKLEKIIQQITRAFETLLDPDARKIYNEGIGGNFSAKQEVEGDIEKAKKHFKLGQTCFKKKDFNNAYNHFQIAARENPNNAIYLGMLSQIEYRHLKKLDIAEQNCKKAIKLTPNNPKLYIILGKIMKELNKTDAAKEAFNQTLKIEPKNQIALNELRKLK